MLIITHLVAGFLIGSLVNNQILVVILGLLSHYIMDAIPHWDPKLVHSNGKKHMSSMSDWDAQPAYIKHQVFLMVLIHVPLIFYFISFLRDEVAFGLILLGGIAATLPDLYDLTLGILLPVPHMHFFKHKHISWKRGVFMQTLFIIVCLMLVVRQD
jgi:hypothetical protein